MFNFSSIANIVFKAAKVAYKRVYDQFCLEFGFLYLINITYMETLLSLRFMFFEVCEPK